MLWGDMYLIGGDEDRLKVGGGGALTPTPYINKYQLTIFGSREI